MFWCMTALWKGTLDIRSIRNSLITYSHSFKDPHSHSPWFASRLPGPLKASVFGGQLMAFRPPHRLQDLLILRLLWKQFALKGFRFAHLTVGRAFVKMPMDASVCPPSSHLSGSGSDHIRHPTYHNPLTT